MGVCLCICASKSGFEQANFFSPLCLSCVRNALLVIKLRVLYVTHIEIGIVLYISWSVVKFKNTAAAGNAPFKESF